LWFQLLEAEVARGFTGLKWRMARVLNAIGVTPLLLAAGTKLRRKSIRIINCHATPKARSAGFERQLQFYQRHYCCDVTPDDLHGLVYHGVWEKPRPGLIITFDDGFYSNYRVAAPLLEKYGMAGWFFLPTEFLGTPPADQHAFAEQGYMLLHEELLDPEAQERLAMTWDEARDLAKRHVIGSHTRTHRRMIPAIGPEQIEDEVVNSRRILEERLQVPIRSFCWVGGEPGTYSAAVARKILAAGYEFGFVTTSAIVGPHHDPFQLHRSNVEPCWDLAQTRFQISGLMDIVNRRRREQVAQVTGSKQCVEPTAPQFA